MSPLPIRYDAPLKPDPETESRMELAFAQGARSRPTQFRDEGCTTRDAIGPGSDANQASNLLVLLHASLNPVENGHRIRWETGQGFSETSRYPTPKTSGAEDP